MTIKQNKEAHNRHTICDNKPDHILVDNTLYMAMRSSEYLIRMSNLQTGKTQN